MNKGVAATQRKMFTEHVLSVGPELLALDTKTQRGHLLFPWGMGRQTDGSQSGQCHGGAEERAGSVGACAGSGDPIQLLWFEAGFLEKVTFLFCLGG